METLNFTRESQKCKTVRLLYLRVLHPWIQPTLDWKYLGGKPPFVLKSTDFFPCYLGIKFTLFM